MQRMWASLGSATLLLALSCQPKPSRPVLYGPWEEGLTLAYEDPSLPAAQQKNQRLQLRVTHARMAPHEPGLVQLELTSLSGQVLLSVRHKNGGVTLVTGDHKPISQVLPEGFPLTTTWVDHGTSYRVIGRATWRGASILPPGTEAVGFWVESLPAHGPRRHSLFLPNLGEVETREWREGAWVTMNRLVAQGFTDLPSHTPSR